MVRNEKPSVFQVLLLDNDASQDVEVRESETVNFLQVKEHLKNGGSVFITSKNLQKIKTRKNRSQQNYSRSRRTIGFLFRQRVRTS